MGEVHSTLRRLSETGEPQLSVGDRGGGWLQRGGRAQRGGRLGHEGRQRNGEWEPQKEVGEGSVEEVAQAA